MIEIGSSSGRRDRGERVYRILRHLRPIVLASARIVEDRVREHGWTVGSRAVMQVLVENGAATVPQVAARLDLARQNVQRHVDVLLQLGHVSRRDNPAHRRSPLIEPTSEGRVRFERLHAADLSELASLAETCSLTELAVTEAVLAAIEDDVRAKATDHEVGRTVEGDKA